MLLINTIYLSFFLPANKAVSDVAKRVTTDPSPVIPVFGLVDDLAGFEVSLIRF